MIRVRTGSRLHFGVLSLDPAAHSGRWFGGVGLMVEAPGVQVSLEPARQWSAHGALAQRALAFAERFVQSLEPTVNRQPFRIVVETCAPEHAGLGTGTQLGLATAQALAEAYGLGDVSAVDLAQRVGRGKRSALGVHGFAQGGFLVEAGKRADQTIAALVARMDFPETWRIVLILPSGGRGLSGVNEVEAFARLDRIRSSDQQTNALCRLVLLGMLPAIAEADLSAFGEALYEFNRRVGELFQPVQGGIYADPRSAEIVNYLRQQGIRGVGQSSWGPTLFAVVEDEERARYAISSLSSRLGARETQVITTVACNRGSTVSS
jgi:beta-ribofuranosylaminobenzene 5'-phosphate synthase